MTTPAVTVTVPGAGTATITRVPADHGSDHAEIRLTVILPGDPHAAELRLTALTTHMQALIGPARPATAHKGAPS